VIPNCGHGSGICDRCQAALDELVAFCEDLGLVLDVEFILRGGDDAS